jgi:hypothetical protein
MKSSDIKPLSDFIRTINPNVNLTVDRTRLINSFIDSLVCDRITIAEFGSIHELLKKNSRKLFITPGDILVYFDTKDDWTYAPKLIQLISRDILMFLPSDKLHVLNEIGKQQCECEAHFESWKTFYPSVALMARNNSEVLRLLKNNLHHIVENDNEHFYRAICDHVFELNTKFDDKDIGPLYSLESSFEFKPNSKCSKLMYTTIQCVMEKSSFEEYNKKIVEVLSEAKPTVDESVHKSKVESTLNIIEMVSNDIAALSLEAERINTCVRDAKMTLSSVKN